MYYIGIDLGGTTIKGGIVDENGKILISKAIPTNSHRHGKEIIKSIADLSNELISTYNLSLEQIKSIGIGMPGIVDSQNKNVILSSNLNFKNVNVESEIKKYLNLEVFIENDANCATIAEFYFGGMKGFLNGIMITVGTGIGGGIILKGKLLKGKFLGEGELGHTIVDYSSSENCKCGQKGCLECFASATSIIKNAKALASKNPNTKILSFVNSIEEIDAKAVFDAYDLGDEIATKVIDKFNEYMAVGIVNFVNVFKPDVICIGGGVSARKEKLTNPIQEMTKRIIFEKPLLTKVIPATLGNDAGIIGAAMIKKAY